MSLERGNNVGGLAGIIQVENKEECALKCANTIECRVWTFKKSIRECWLKSDESRKFEDNDYITGTKSCGPGNFSYEQLGGLFKNFFGPH